MDVERFISDNLLTAHAFVLVAALLGGFALGRYLRREVMFLPIWILLSLCVPVLAGAAFMLGGILVQIGLISTLDVASQDPMGFVAFLAELGLELSVLGLLVSPIGVLLGRRSARHAGVQGRSVQ